MKPKRQKKAIVTEPLAAVKRGLRKRPTSSIGAEVRRSHITKAASRTVAIAKPPSVRALPQPWLGASMIVKISSPIAAVENTSPPRSIRGACGSRDVGTTEATKTAAAAATGAIAKKMLVQEKRSSSQPPAIGPRAIAAPAVAPQKPIALALSARSVKTLEISESVAGKIIAAPSPITQRAVISWPGVLIRPPSRLAPPKTPRPASKIPLRPTRSLRLPEASSSAAKTRL